MAAIKATLTPKADTNQRSRRVSACAMEVLTSAMSVFVATCSRSAAVGCVAMARPYYAQCGSASMRGGPACHFFARAGQMRGARRVFSSGRCRQSATRRRGRREAADTHRTMRLVGRPAHA